MPDQPRQHRDGIGFDDQLLVIGRVALRDHPGVAGLVVFLGRKADREGLDRAAPDARHHRDDGGGIDPAGQKGAERHVRDQSQPHRLLELRDQLAAQFRGRRRRRRRARLRQAPIAHQLGLAEAAVRRAPRATR